MGVSRMSIAVAALALAASALLQMAPHYWMYLPYGYLPWALLGNPMPPFYRTEQFEVDSFGNWTRDGDVFVASGAKCGTNWILYTTHLIRTKGVGDLIDTNVDMPWVELRHKPGETWAEMYKILNTHVLDGGVKLKDRWDNPAYPFRVFKSHMTPFNGLEYTSTASLPVRQFPKVKFIAISRNGMDMLLSFHNFVNKPMNPKWIKTFGWFRPGGTLDSMIDLMMPGGWLEDVYIGYTKAWWNYRHDDNVLLLHYSDLRKDFRKSVQRIADFVGVSLTADEFEEVVRKGDIKFMSTIKDKFKIMIYGNPNVDYGLCSKEVCGEESSVIGQGMMGEGKVGLTEEQQERWRKGIDAGFQDPELRRWAEHGGDYR